MKRIRVLQDPTPGLAEYLDAVDNASWEEFGAHNAGRRSANCARRWLETSTTSVPIARSRSVHIAVRLSM